MTVVEATEQSIEAAGDDLTPRDQGAVRALLKLAAKIDAMEEGGKTDIVSIPTYLKFCEALHLTPASRAKLPEKPEESTDGVDDLRARRAKRSA